MSNKRIKEVNELGPLIKIGSGIALAILLIPVFIVVLTGLNSGDHLTFPPKGLSLRWIFAFFQSEEFLSAFLFSFGLAVIVGACPCNALRPGKMVDFCDVLAIDALSLWIKKDGINHFSLYHAAIK
ncbi:MAG: hypothetical protein ACPHI1_01065 [Candidatus Puniceispirillaceae bacterium]